jgi:hypothetical protein
MSDTSFPDDIYQYAERAQAALLGMIRDVMREAAQNGLAGGHHFYLTFSTRAPGVHMSDKLRAAHSEEITIVLQNQFENLVVDDEKFSVTLYFNQQPEDLVVPWDALSKFYDPSVAFGLMFDVEDNEAELASPEALEAMLAQSPVADDDAASADEPPVTGEVVSLDSFRDK